jgi:hypothetical protein
LNGMPKSSDRKVNPQALYNGNVQLTHRCKFAMTTIDYELGWAVPTQLGLS